MKKLVLFFVLGVVGFNASFAQRSVGFSDPLNIQPLLDYRLPDWGYSYLWLDFSMRGDVQNQRRNLLSGEFERFSRNTALSLDPRYNLYRESEKRIFAFTGDLTLGLQDRRETVGEDEEERMGSTLNSNVTLTADLKEYLTPQFFLLINQDAGLLIDYSTSEETIDNSLIGDVADHTRRFTSRSRLGLGVGRIRNVTPIIRAIRLGERYRELAAGDRLSTEEVQAAADEFTRFQGYQETYTRPGKYFWEAMDGAVNNALTGLDPFALLYLTDVLDEVLGERLEGWEIAAGGTFAYSHSLDRRENRLGPDAPVTTRITETGQTAGPFASLRWFKNLSLAHQIGFTAEAERTYFIETDPVLINNTNAFAELSWTWVIADRMLLSTRLSNLYYAFEYEEDAAVGNNTRWDNTTTLSSSLVLFVENRLALSLSASQELLYRGDTASEFTFDQRISQLRYNAGIRYYFSRNLY